MSKYDIDNYMPILSDMAAACEGGYVLELGVGQLDGSTAAFIEGLKRWQKIQAAHQPLMVSVDWQMDFTNPQLNPELPSWWHFVLGSTLDPQTFKFVSAYRSPDIIFIDTEHSYEQMSAELALWGRLTNRYTTWLFHDTYMFGQYNHMTDAIKEYAAASGWVYDDVSVEAHGLGRMRAK